MSIFSRITNLFSRDKVQREIDAELRSHIEMRIDDNLRAGMSVAEARRDALLRFGNPTVMRERTVNADSALALSGLGRDLRLSFRQLRKSPGFTLTAVLTLAMAIGANAVVFSILNALVLRPLNLPDAQRLFNVNVSGQSLNSYPDYLDLRDHNRIFDGIAAYNFTSAGLNTAGNPTQIWLYEASGNYFDVLGVKPYLGRFFHQSDEHGRDSSPYVVLSYAYWHSQFAGDPSVVGRSVQLNRHPFTILGVAPQEFRGTELFFAPAVWAPLIDQAQIEGSYDLEDRRGRSMWLMARLKPQVTATQAETDLNAVAAYLKKTYPKDDDDVNFTLVRPGLLGDLLGNPVRAFVAGLTALAALILLAACANLGSLFAARATDRVGEIALRLALGSTRTRILRQLLTEALLVSLAGGAAGIAGSVMLLRVLSVWQPLPRVPVSVPVNPDLRTYAVAIALALFSGLLCGAVPVRQIFGALPWEVVKTGTKITKGGRWVSARDILLVIQIAVCAVLMTSSLVAVRGLARSMHSSFGFRPENAVLVNSDLNMAGYSSGRWPAMQKRMIDAVAALPGVTSVGLIDNVPLGLGWDDSDVYASDTTDFRQSKSILEATHYRISPGYFQAAGTALLSGRSFTWQDDANAPHVALVNRIFAQRVFGSVSKAVGSSFRLDAKTRIEVIGVVEDGKYKTLTENPQPVFFEPILQAPVSATWLIVRYRSDPQAPLARATAIHNTLQNLDPGLPYNILSWPDQLDSALFAARAATVSLGVLGLLGAMLAVTGIFGMASYSVGKRLREMGIRVALGAGHGQILQAALGRAFRLLALGSVAGLVLGMAATRVLSCIVYQAAPGDPLVLTGSVAAMLLLGLIAAWGPARRALSVDPSRLMREE